MRPGIRKAGRAIGIGWLAGVLALACSWDPSRPFEREAPPVRAAIVELDAGDAQAATATLQEYLATGACSGGNIGTPPRLNERPNGSFDLGLALFKVAEAVSRRLGDEEIDAGAGDPAETARRSEQVDCALRVVRAVASDPKQPVELRARARYLEGNLLFLNGAYEEAVRAYDAALELAPGMTDAGPLRVGDAGRTYDVDPVGRDAAWNRAIALRRIEDKKDAGNDASEDAKPDGGGDGGGQGEGGKNDDGDGGGDSGAQDSGASDDDKKDDDAKKDAAPPKEEPKKPEDEKDAGALPPPPPPSRASQDERMLDQLENAPTVQQENARKQGRRRRATGMADK